MCSNIEHELIQQLPYLKLGLKHLNYGHPNAMQARVGLSSLSSIVIYWKRDRSGLVDTLFTHANMKGFGLTPLFGDRRGYMPPQLKTKQKQV